MRIGLASAAMVSLALLAACDGTPGADAPANTAAAAPTPETVAPTPPAMATPTPASTPVSRPTTDVTTGQRTPADAAAVVQAYYAAIDRGDFDAAYALWDRDGAASHQTLAQFKRGFAETATTAVETGAPTNGEGAAGSVYIDVPVTVTATLKDGTKQRFTGTYTLRRVNDVPGATPEQLSWHLASATLHKK